MELKTLSNQKILFVQPTPEFLSREDSGEISAAVAANYREFLETVNHTFLSHSAVTQNQYSNWFRHGEATLNQLQDLTIQFSIFSNYFLIAQAKKMIHARSLNSMRLAKEILANEIGVVFNNGSKEIESELLGVTGSVEGGTFRFKAAHFEWLVDFAKPLGLEFHQLSRMEFATKGTRRFCDELERLYGGEDANISSGAGFAVENWAAAGFWQELEDGLTLIRESWLPELRVAYWSWHNRIEAQHAEHTHKELEDIYFAEDFDEQKFLEGGSQILDGVQAFWSDLELQRVDTEPAAQNNAAG